MNNQEQHITAEQIQRYVSHRMNEKERAAFEVKLENDPFAKEAVEGFNSLSDPQDGDLLYASTAALISAKAGLPSKAVTGVKMVSLYKVGTIAASVTLLVASAFWINSLFNNSDSTMAEAVDQSIEEESLDAKSENNQDITPVGNGVGYIDTLPNPDFEGEISDGVIGNADLGLVSEVKTDEPLGDDKNITTTITTNTNLPESIVVEEEEAEFDEDISQIYSLGSTEEEVVESPSVTTSEQYKKEKDNKITTEAQNLGGMFYDTEATTESDELESNAPSPKDETTIYKHGLALFQAGEYTDAITAFEEAIRNKQHLDEAHYYQGLCYYYLEKYIKATKHLDLMITNGTPFKPNAQWYKADILLKKGKIEEAKVIFESLAQGNSSFKELAQEKLDTL